MTMRPNFQLCNKAPSTPVEEDTRSGGDTSNSAPSPSNSVPSPSTSTQSSPESFDQHSLACESHWQNRRSTPRRKCALRNIEKRPYHLPTHISPPHDAPMTKNELYFALDCEMVGVGPEGLESAVARVTICNWAEEVVLDTFVKCSVEVTDYRTFVSGIEAKDLKGDQALSLNTVRKMVKDILHGKILIGHALENDLAALQIVHPWHDIRDSANYPPFMKKERKDGTTLRPRKLKELVREKLGREIQNIGKAHDPIEDARSALSLYKLERLAWERIIMEQVASARVKEGRESGPSGRDSPYSAGPESMKHYSQSLMFRSRVESTNGLTHTPGFTNQVPFSHQPSSY